MSGYDFDFRKFLGRQKSSDDAEIAQLRAEMQQVAAALDKTFNGDLAGTRAAPVGFAFTVFPAHTTNGRSNYVSNCSRDIMLKVLKEQIRCIEAGEGDSLEGGENATDSS